MTVHGNESSTVNAFGLGCGGIRVLYRAKIHMSGNRSKITGGMLGIPDTRWKDFKKTKIELKDA